jgi:hypothetical protein
MKFCLCYKTNICLDGQYVFIWACFNGTYVDLTFSQATGSSCLERSVPSVPAEVVREHPTSDATFEQGFGN